MVLLGDKTGLLALIWEDGVERAQAHLRRHLGEWRTHDVPSIPGISDAFSAYLDGDITALETVAMRPPGTAFQRKVWGALQTIDAGQTWSYKQVAGAIGQPTACRAVAAANGANPIPIFIPCHRVISADGGLGGFSCGLDRKVWLLKHERARPASNPSNPQTFRRHW